MRAVRSFVLLTLILIGCASTTAVQIVPSPQEIAPGVYVIIGDLGPQRFENKGLNANLGFVVGDDAVLVINTGPSKRVGDAFIAEIRRITDKPIRWVVNVNSQSHYWWGNAAFAAAGATLMAHPAAIDTMRSQMADQRAVLNALLKDRFTGSSPVLPTEAVAERRAIDLGRRAAHVLYFGGAHTPGDVVVWLPAERILFAGDIVYTERLLAVLPISQTQKWLHAFSQIEALTPNIVVPGHGRPTTLARAIDDTREYLRHLREQAKRLFEAGVGPGDAAARIDQSRWRHLANFEELHRRNANMVFLEIERELF